jgi:hypothetical protein
LSKTEDGARRREGWEHRGVFTKCFSAKDAYSSTTEASINSALKRRRLVCLGVPEPGPGSLHLRFVALVHSQGCGGGFRTVQSSGNRESGRYVAVIWVEITSGGGTILHQGDVERRATLWKVLWLKKQADGQAWAAPHIACSVVLRSRHTVDSSLAVIH